VLIRNGMRAAAQLSSADGGKMRCTTTTAVLALCAALAACSENTVAPDVTSSQAVVGTSALSGGATHALSSTDTTRFTITIDPAKQTNWSLGAGNSITFPVNSLCDPTKSTYGATEWDKPCTLATSPLIVQVRAWTDAKGHSRVDFTPNVRFSPSAAPVVISFSDREAAINPLFNILYCKNPSGACQDEALSDPSLLTMRDPINGKVTRRIKHFSGYNVAAGEGEELLDPLGIASLATPSFTVALAERKRQLFLLSAAVGRSKSGYILASG
jgi:hypothetical protein